MNILDLLMFLPSIIILGLMLWLYFFNRKANINIMNQSVEKLEPAFQRIGVNRLEMTSEGMNGRSYDTKVKPGSKLRDLKIHYSMEERHLLPSWLISKFTAPRDFLIIESKLEKGVKALFNMEIIDADSKNQIRANKDKLNTMEDIRLSIKQLEDTYLFKSSNLKGAEVFFVGDTGKASKRNDLPKLLYVLRDNIMRISFDMSKKMPLTILIRIDDSLDYGLLAKLTKIVISRVNYACTRDYIRKKRHN